MFFKVAGLFQRMIRNRFVILKTGEWEGQAVTLPFLY